MEFGICVATKIDDVGVVSFAENLGYTHAWIPDSQMIWSDCYAYLALAAQQTRSIRLGTGVSVTGTRIAPVTAHSIATINRLAPGRTFLGLGTGNTAHRLMGQRPMKFAAFEEYVRITRALLDGDEVEFTFNGTTQVVQFQMANHGFIDIEHHIPLYVSGFYPRTLRLSGQYGDGLVCSIPPHDNFVSRALSNVRSGAAEVGRTLTDNFDIASLGAAIVLERGESITSQRVIDEVGPFAISSMHYIYDKLKENGGEPPPHMQPHWKEYVELVEAVPPSHRHMRVHAGHCTVVLPEEQKFITPALIRGTCLVGQPEEVIEQVHQLDAAGLNQFILLPSPGAQYRNLQDFSQKVMAKL